MGIIICIDACKDCGKNFLKDPSCLGDYSEEGVLLRYCPCCGQMFPYLNIVFKEKNKLSNNMKRKTGTRLAAEHNLDHKVMSSLIKTINETEDKKAFAHQLSEKINAVFNLDLTYKHVLNSM